MNRRRRDWYNSYEDKCECSRINEIVNGIGGKSVIIIRYNPDKIINDNKEIIIEQINRLKKLIKIIKYELSKDYNKFRVKLIQLHYNDNNEKYKYKKTENITDIVCI